MTTAPPAYPRPTKWIAAISVLGLVTVVLAVLLAVEMVSDGEQVGDSAQSSADAACALIAQVPDDGFDMGSQDDESYPPHLSRLAAAETLAMLAEAEDGDYKDLYEEIRKPRHVVNERFDAEGEDFVAALGEARTACSDEGF